MREGGRKPIFVLPLGCAVREVRRRQRKNKRRVNVKEDEEEGEEGVTNVFAGILILTYGNKNLLPFYTLEMNRKYFLF